MNYKVGDKFKVKKGLDLGKKYTAVLAREMAEMGGQILTFKRYCGCGLKDHLFMNENDYLWSSAMLEPVEQGMMIEDIKIGMKVVPFQKTAYTHCTDWDDFKGTGTYKSLVELGYLEVRGIDSRHSIAVGGVCGSPCYEFKPCDLKPYKPVDKLAEAEAKLAEWQAEVDRIKAEIEKANRPKMCRLDKVFELPKDCKDCGIEGWLCATVRGIGKWDAEFPDGKRPTDCPLKIVEVPE